MNTNIAIQNVAIVGLTETIARSMDIRGYANFGWTILVTGAIDADLTLDIEFADPDVADDTTPGAFSAVLEPAICSNPGVGQPSQIIIPAGTPEGTTLGGTIPCRAGAFIRIVAAAGAPAPLPVEVVYQRQGPTGYGQYNDPRS